MSQLSEDEFAEVSHRAPYQLLQVLTEETSRDPRALVRRAILHLMVNDYVEAHTLSTEALRRRSQLDPRSVIRALVVRGTTAPLLFLDVHGRIHFLEALSLIRDLRLEGSEAHVGLLINWACSQGSTGDAGAALQTLGRAEQAATALAASETRRQSHLQTIEFNRLLLTTVPAAMPEAMAGFVEAAEAAASFGLAGRAHAFLAETLAQNDLYTAGLHHAARGQRMFAAADMPAQARESRLQTAKILMDLGARERAQDVIADQVLMRATTSWAVAEVQRLVVIGDYIEWLANYEEAKARYRDALEVLLPVIARGPGLAMQLPLTDILVRGLMLCHKTGEDPRGSIWIQVLDQVTERLRGLPKGEALSLVLDLLGAWMCRDDERVEHLYKQVQHAATDSTLPGARELPSIDVLGGFDGVLTSYIGGDPTPAADVAEYWEHITQLTAEDDEVVRAAHRRANVLPVLHRLLARRQLEDWGEFEAIELSRWGSLMGGLGTVAGDSATKRGALRAAFLQGAASQGVVYPAALGRARGIQWGAWPGGVHPESWTLREPAIDLRRLIAEGDWSDAPDLVQLYLRGDELHWALIDTDRDTIAKGRRELSPHALQLLRAANAWASPEIGQIDRDVASTASVHASLLPVIAAIRCCMGPFVDRPDLARDFALHLPPSAVRRVGQAVSAQATPALADVAREIGTLFPPSIWRPSERPLLLSLSHELVQLPLALAWTGEHGYLFMRRMTMLLPPINTLASRRSRRANSVVRRWRTLVVGNARGELGFTSGIDASIPLRAAFIQRDEAAGNTAVVYKGHYAATLGAPSGARMTDPGAPDAPLTAAELLASAGSSPARIALMCCHGAGLHFIDEWGGIASALMVNGAAEIFAPSWPIIDSLEASRMDALVEAAIGTSGALERSLYDASRAMIDAWLSRNAEAVAPHWWSGFHLLKG